MTPDYKTRRDAESESHEESDIFCAGADWARADLMASVEEILVKALETVSKEKDYVESESTGMRQYFATPGAGIALDALTKWQAIKGES